MKGELPEEVANSLAAYVGCIAGAIRIEDYQTELLRAGFEFVEIVDSGADLNAYAKVENLCACLASGSYTCCSPAAALDPDLSALRAQHDVNRAAASVRVYAIKPSG